MSQAFDKLIIAVNARLDALSFSKKVKDTWTRGICEQYFRSVGIDYAVSEPIKCETGEYSYLVKVFDDYIKYVLTLPNKCYEEQPCPQFIFYTGTPLSDDTCITPNQATVYLIQKSNPQMKVTKIVDDKGNDTTIIRNKLTGESATIVFPKELTDPKTWAFKSE